MKTSARALCDSRAVSSVFTLLSFLLGSSTGLAHPGSGITVDNEGRVYFTDTGQGVWKVDEQGRVTAHEGPAYHWMTIDPKNRFTAAHWPKFAEPSTSIKAVGAHPNLLVSSDFPITTAPDGALYYPQFADGGPLRIYKLDPSRQPQSTVFARLPSGADGTEIKWLNGMASGPDGSIYFTENAAVRRITAQGEVITIARNISVENCRRIDGAPEPLGPLLRGLDVAADGTIYVAASACRALLQVTPQGVVSPILRTDPPWSPTGVAISSDVVYVLEYLHTAGGARREWLPRVRKIAADGTHLIIASIERTGANESRPVNIEAPRRTGSMRGANAGDEREIAGMKFCWCPPGNFKMGSPPHEPNRRPDEEQVDVTFTSGFWMGKFEVTQAQWKRVMGTAHGEIDDPRRTLNAGVGDNFPIYWVSYGDAEDFCRKLTAQAHAAGDLPDGWQVRLPTEAQWEYACRAGTSTAYSFGDTLTQRQANIGKPYNGTPTGLPGSAAAEVGSYPANPWGLHDMHGNEFEWCRDWYQDRLPGGSDPFQGQTGSPNRDGSFSRVRRGGAWTDPAEFCRSALRLRFEPHRSSDHIGFRVALVPE